MTRAALRQFGVVGDQHQVVCCARFSSNSRSMMRAPVVLSRLPVGSSANSRAGRVTKARAMATRCCSPPDSWRGVCSSRGPRPTRSSQSRACICASRGTGEFQRQHDVFQAPSGWAAVETTGRRSPCAWRAGAHGHPRRASSNRSVPAIPRRCSEYPDPRAAPAAWICPILRHRQWPDCRHG